MSTEKSPRETYAFSLAYDEAYNDAWRLRSSNPADTYVATDELTLSIGNREENLRVESARRAGHGAGNRDGLRRINDGTSETGGVTVTIDDREAALLAWSK